MSAPAAPQSSPKMSLLCTGLYVCLCCTPVFVDFVCLLLYILMPLCNCDDNGGLGRVSCLHYWVCFTCTGRGVKERRIFLGWGPHLKTFNTNTYKCECSRWWRYFAMYVHGKHAQLTIYIVIDLGRHAFACIRVFYLAIDNAQKMLDFSTIELRLFIELFFKDKTLWNHTIYLNIN